MPFTVRIANQNKSFIVEANETILDGALRQNFDVEHSCCEGICGSCEAQIVDGRVSYLATDHLVLDENDRQSGRTLLCSAYAKSDLLLDISSCTFPPLRAPHHFTYALATLEQISADVYRAILAPTTTFVKYRAGQYGLVDLPDQEATPFSIANAPRDDHHIELHIRCQPDNTYAQNLLAHLEQHKTLRLQGPFGNCYYHPTPSMPNILIAVGTGFSPIKAILEAMFKQGLQHETRLFWAGKTRDDFYQLALAQQWAQEHTLFSVTPVLMSDTKLLEWSGEYGNVIDCVANDFPSLAHHHIYFGGPMQLTFDGLERFIAQGAETCYMYSDVFDLV